MDGDQNQRLFDDAEFSLSLTKSGTKGAIVPLIPHQLTALLQT